MFSGSYVAHLYEEYLSGSIAITFRECFLLGKLLHNTIYEDLMWIFSAKVGLTLINVAKGLTSYKGPNLYVEL